MKGPPKIIVLDTPELLANRAASGFAARARSAVQARGEFTVALSGGSTPAALYGLLASPRFCGYILWPSVRVFWGDERCVPPDDADSNFAAADRALLSRVPLPNANVHRMKGELEPRLGALDYREQLRAHFGESTTRFDLVLLGLGPDGHTASLFPHTQALEVVDSTCVANHVRTAPVAPWRLTLTYPAINAARAVWFLVEGEGKAQIAAEVLDGPENVLALPAQGVRPSDGELLWMLDRAAARLLK